MVLFTSVHSFKKFSKGWYKNYKILSMSNLWLDISDWDKNSIDLWRLIHKQV